MAADLLVGKGHSVVLHARNAKRVEEAHQELPGAEAMMVGDIETIAGAKDLAAQVNALGRFDAVIHNAAVGYREGHRVTADGLPHVFAINTLSAYILTALIERPKRLVYLSSGMHHHADANLDDIGQAHRERRKARSASSSPKRALSATAWARDVRHSTAIITRY
jgi:NAD(P)-dependent dehydrogenase (short-subunit alcohol dehydrogenase family)